MQIINFIQSAPAYLTDYSMTLNGTDEYASFTPLAAGDSRTVMTVSAWVLRGSTGSEQHIFGASDSAGNNLEVISFDSSDRLVYRIFVGGAEVVNYTTTATYTSTSAWYHIHVTRNGNTVTITVDGTVVSAFDTSDAPTGDNGMLGYTEAHFIGRKVWAANSYFNGKIADLAYLDGVSSAASNFITGAGGSPKDLTGLSFGTSGFWQRYQNSAYLGADFATPDSGHAPADSCTGGTPSSSAGTAANAFDDNIGTLNNFATTSMPQYVRYDFGSGVDITRAKIDIEQINAAAYDWEVNYSDDAWSGSTTADSGTHASSLLQEDARFSSVGSHRYWEVRFTAWTSASNGNIAEISMHIPGDGINHYDTANIDSGNQSATVPT
jgi:hypothetical protein